MENLKAKVVRKNIKGASFVFRRGELILNVPSFYSEKRINETLEKNESRIQKFYEEIQKKYRFIEEGDSILFCGSHYFVSYGEVDAIDHEKKRITIRKKDSKIHKILEKDAKSWVDGGVKAIFDKEGLDDISTRYNWMSSRWGSCTKAKRRMSFSLYLSFYPAAARDSVIYHEMAHLKESGHQKAFYNEVLRLYPDYHSASRLLKSPPPIFKSDPPIG